MRESRPVAWYAAPAFVLVAGCMIAIINFGIRSSFGLFTVPISEANQWPREIFSIALALQNLVWGLATIVAGMLTDRFGAGRVIILGSLFYAVGIVVMESTASPVWFHLGAGVLIGIGIALSSFSIVMVALGRLVPPEKRSWAFGLATASSSLGQFIFAPLAAALTAAYGWQATLQVMALCALLIIPFAAPLLAVNTAGRRATKDETDLSMMQAIGQAFSHGSYNLLVAGFFVCGFQLSFVSVHLPPFLADQGISKEMAGVAMGAIGLFNVAGAYASGIIGGRREKRLPLSLIYLLRSILIAGYILLPISPVTTLLFTSCLGLLWLSTVPLTMGLVTVMFGTRYMATLYGFVFLSHQIGSFLGVWLGGKLFDLYGNYDLVWWLCVALGLFAAAVNLPIREKRAARFAAS